MDATRPRRTRDSIRQGWYARQRSVRFARRLGFAPTTALAPVPEALPWGLLACWPGRTLNGPVQGVSPMVLAGDLFVHVVHWGILASFLCAFLAWRSSERLCHFPLTFPWGSSSPGERAAAAAPAIRPRSQVPGMVIEAESGATGRRKHSSDLVPPAWRKTRSRRNDPESSCGGPGSGQSALHATLANFGSISSTATAAAFLTPSF